MMSICPWCFNSFDAPTCPSCLAPMFSREDVDPDEREEFSGRKLDIRYRVTRFIGRGGMGSVYKAYDRMYQRLVAVKFLAPRQGSSPELIERFTREAAALARLNSPNIVAFFDIGLAGGADGRTEVPFLVTELLRGETLQDRLCREGRIADAREAARLLLDVCNALVETHRTGLIHRDLKPANVFLHRTGDGPPVPKLIDYGIAKSVERAEMALTGAGQVIGTVEYMAPEQISLGTLSAATDMYALGILAYRVLAGSCPFIGEPLTVMYQHKDRAPPPITTPGVPQGLVDLVFRLLAKSPEDRPRAGETLPVLQYFASEHALPDVRSMRDGGDTGPMVVDEVLRRPSGGSDQVGPTVRMQVEELSLPMPRGADHRWPPVAPMPPDPVPAPDPTRVQESAPPPAPALLAAMVPEMVPQPEPRPQPARPVEPESARGRAPEPVQWEGPGLLLGRDPAGRQGQEPRPLAPPVPEAVVGRGREPEPEPRPQPALPVEPESARGRAPEPVQWEGPGLLLGRDPAGRHGREPRRGTNPSADSGTAGVATFRTHDGPADASTPAARGGERGAAQGRRRHAGEGASSSRPSSRPGGAAGQQRWVAPVAAVLIGAIVVGAIIAMLLRTPSTIAGVRMNCSSGKVREVVGVVGGRVAGATGGLSAFTLSDDTGGIWVLSDRGVAAESSRVRIRGRTGDPVVFCGGDTALLDRIREAHGPDPSCVLLEESR